MPELLPNRVLAYIRQHALLRPGHRLGVAISGGADSVALLRLLLELRGELGCVLSVVHFNHRMRAQASDADEKFVRELARQHNLECQASSGDTPAHAQSRKLSLETAARELRYAFFHALIESGVCDRIATAHTLDDQAETVLLRLLRGAGTRGLAGIYPRLLVPSDTPARSCGAGLPPALVRGPRPHQQDQTGAIVRPLLTVRRAEIEAYLQRLNQPWCEDATNQDMQHARNRVRHQLLPVLERDFNPAIRERLAELADVARAEDQYLEAQAAEEARRLLLAESVPEPVSPAVVPRTNPPALRLDPLAALPLALQRLIVRRLAATAGITLSFDEVARVLALADPNTAGRIQLHDGWTARRELRHLASAAAIREEGKPRPRTERLLAFERQTTTPAADRSFAYVFTWPAELSIPELGSRLRVRLVDPRAFAAAEAKIKKPSSTEAALGYNSGQLLNPHKLTAELTVRNWHPGDRFWPAHTRMPRKIKELLQQRRVTGDARVVWPVIVSGNDIVWVRGFAVPDQFRADEHSEAALEIDEIAI